MSEFRGVIHAQHAVRISLANVRELSECVRQRTAGDTIDWVAVDDLTAHLSLFASRLRDATTYLAEQGDVASAKVVRP